MSEESAELRKQVEAFRQVQIMAMRDKLSAEAKEINGIKVIRFEGTLAPDQIKTLAFQLRNIHSEKLFFVAGCVADGKPSITVLLSDDLVEQGLNAVGIAREAAKEIQGGGGGQPFFASAGGKNSDGIKKAIDKALEAINQ
ncbi:hypothetical protein SDC9_94364 [bioreactor metagenome]|uniref:Alanine--tRNA ligase n=1 Tax=bioreactor metagenome TaxID=1076179 RepID=A0A645A9Z4_9ZZZZ